MTKDNDKLQSQHIEDKADPESRIFVLVAGVVMVAAITFGVLNTFNVIHM